MHLVAVLISTGKSKSYEDLEKINAILLILLHFCIVPIADRFQPFGEHRAKRVAGEDGKRKLLQLVPNVPMRLTHSRNTAQGILI